MSALEAAVAEVEACLGALSRSLGARDSAAIEAAATALQRALAGALDAGRGVAPGPALRERLLRAGGLAGAQRDSLARASATLERSIDVLLPRQASGYSARGGAVLAAHSGHASA